MIRAVSLINGELILGDVEDHIKEIQIFNPFYIVDEVNEDGISGSKLTNVLTFSSSDYIVVNKDKVVFDFPVSETMSTYYKRLVSLYSKKTADDTIREALNEMDRAEKRYEKLMSMIKPDKTQLN